MFAEIKTNGAHTIVIAIPHEGADKTLPALARMLENNAVFFSSPNWRDNNIVQPNMTIHLGDSYQFENRDEKILVQLPDCDAIISSEWQAATPNVFVSNRKAIEKLEQRLKERDDQVQLLNLQLNQANEKLQAMQDNKAESI
jgi:hypothetical protein